MRPRLTPSTTQRRRFLAAALGLAGVALIGAALAGTVGRSRQDVQLDSSSQFVRRLPEPGAPGIREATAAPKPLPKPAPKKKLPTRRLRPQMPPPVRLAVPAIGVKTSVIPLGLNADGTMQTPETAGVSGWFAPGPEPGEQGAAVIVGHVDSYIGPGVFYHLRALRRGDRITVALRDREQLHWVVTGSRQVSKDNFPTQLVFAHTKQPTLRLITCGGRFNRSTGHYVDNYIVFARLVSEA